MSEKVRRSEVYIREAAVSAKVKASSQADASGASGYLQATSLSMAIVEQFFSAKVGKQTD